MLIKTFRLFVSSTFADFAAEREVLQAQVFPVLDAYCAAKSYQFYPLDLRWGISEEAGRDQRTADICLEEVEAANGYPPPNFLILLGDRYGWVPLPFAIARDEFEAMLEWLARCGDQDGAEALRYVYRLDENRLIPAGLKGAGPDISAYTLRSREDDLPELKAREAWKAIEDKVRAALQKVADGLLQEGQIDPAAREKYILSLTEREIRGNLDATTQNARGAEAIAFIRTLIGPCDTLREREQQSAAAVAALKSRVGRTLAEDRIVFGTATCDDAGSLDPAYLVGFATAIEAKLKEAIDRHIAKVEAIERGPDYALHAEREEHRAFRAEKLKVFVGRESNVSAIARYIASDAARPLVLHGPSGSGKTALMARAVEAAENSGHAPLVTRFIGASAGSSDLRALLLSVIDDLADHGLVETPTDYDQDANKFSAQIKALLASISGPAVIFLDALDQLKKPYRLDWLPETLPEGVRLVLSVLDDPAYETDSEVYRLLRRRLPEDAFLPIEPLSTAHGRDILLALEAHAKRELRASQRDFVIRHFEVAGASPLYLRTAFEIAKSWRSWEAEAGRHVLAADTTALIGQFIAGLTSEHHHEPELVTRTLGYLAAAKVGLSAKELTDALSNDDGVMRAISTEQHVSHTKRLPPSVWARLHRSLSPFLIEKRIDDQPLLHFFHRQIAEVARTGYYGPARPQLHAALAKYFEERATKQDGCSIYDKRSLSELPYQLHHAGDGPHIARLNEILLSPDWMQQKLHAFSSPLPLIEDYRTFAPYDPVTKTAASLVGRALGQSAGALARDERQLVPHLLSRLSAYMAPNVGAVLSNARRVLRPPALVPRVSRLTPADSALFWTFEGHEGSVNAVAFAPDGRLIVSGSQDATLRLWQPTTGIAIGVPLKGHGSQVHSVSFSPDGTRIASGSADRTIQLWDVATGATVGAPLKGHEHRVLAVAFSPDGKRIVSGSADGTLRLWNVLTGTTIGIPFKGHRREVCAVAFTPDGTRIVSGSGDGTLKVWDADSGAAIGAPFEGHDGQVLALAISPDGARISSGSVDKTIRLWDAKTGAAIGAPLKGHRDRVTAVAFSPDGTLLVSSSFDGTLRLWDAATGLAIGTGLTGHGNRVTSVAYSPDGAYILSGSWDSTLRLWDAASGAAHNEATQEHLGDVGAISFSPDGDRIVSGSIDSRLRLWNAETVDAIGAPLEGHERGVYSVAFSPNGERIVSASYDKTLRLWDAKKRAVIGAPLIGQNPVYAVTFSSDGDRIVSGSSDGTLQLWDTATGAPIGAPLYGHATRVLAVSCSPDGTRIASASRDKTIRQWNAGTGEAIGVSIEGHTDAINAVAFSPDGKLIASGSDDRTIRLWDAATGLAFCAPIKGHEAAVYGIAFAGVSKHIISGAWDRTLRLWDAANGAELARFEGDAGFLSTCSALGIVAAGDKIGRVHVFEWIADASAKVAWLARFEGSSTGKNIAFTSPSQPPADTGTAPLEMRVTAAELVDARWLETYSGRHLFALADGRVYLDGLIAVSSLDHARATLDHMAQHSMDS